MSSFPIKPINVVVRSDSSGTTYVFTKHLAEINSDVRDGDRRREGTQLARGHEVQRERRGDASITTTPGSIGYIEYGYAPKGPSCRWRRWRTRRATLSKPSIESAQAALAAVEMPADLIAWMPDPARRRLLSDRHLHLDHLLQVL